MEIVNIPIETSPRKKKDEIIEIENEKDKEKEKEIRALQEIKDELTKLLIDLSEEKVDKLAEILYNLAREKVYDEESRKLTAIDKMWRGARYIEGYLKDNFRVEKELKTDGNPLVLIVKVWY